MNAKQRHLSVILVLIAMAIVAGTFYLVDQNLRARALADADAELGTRARTLAHAIDRTLEWRMGQVFTFAALPSFRGFATADENTIALRKAIALNELKAIVAADPAVRAASIVDASGTVALTTDGSMNVFWGDRAFVQEALAGHLFGSVPARDFGETVQYYSAPILDNRGEVSGALVVRVAAGELWGVAASPSNSFLVDENGVRIADWSPNPQILVALVPLAPQTAAGAMAEKRYGAEQAQIPATNLAPLAADISRESKAFTFRDAAGQNNRAAIQRLTTYPWTAVVFSSEDSIFSFEVTELLGTLGFSAMAVAGVALVWAAFRISGRRE